MPSLFEMLGQTWPARLAKSAYGAVTLPGDVYAGRVDPLSEEGIGRAADLGGLVMGGTYAGAPAGAMGAGAVKPIRAYHASPHDFDRFDLSKIGTGEGAQAYGHGLYFAENPAVGGRGGEYWKAFLGKFQGTPEGEAARELMHSGFDRTRAIDVLERDLKGRSELGIGPLNPEYAQTRVALERLRSGKPVGPRTYEVNINAAPERMLDWDKPLRDQPIADVVRGVVPRDLRKPFDANVESGITGSNAYRNYIPSQSFAIRSNASAPYGPSGAKTFEEALQMAGGDPSLVRTVLNPSKSGASEALREAGIPGIKYLDQGSRFNQALFNDNPMANEARKFIEAAGGNTEKAAEAFYRSNPVDRWAVPERDEIRRLIQQGGNQPTSNYVLFRDDIIDIVKKYGLAGAAAMYGISQDEAKAAMEDKPKTTIGRQTYEEE